jgi:uncharacterized membrane-anchored protein
MKLSGLLHRSRTALPGLSGVARVDRRTDGLLRRVKAGEIAVIDQVDLDRATAEALVSAQVAAVVNAAPSISGRYPNLGPEVLVAAGILLVDGVGDEALRMIKDGSRIRIHEGVIYAGELELAKGVEQDVDSVADAMVEAKSGLTHQLEAFAANTIEFMRRERSMLLDGAGVPDVEVPLADRQVLVVATGYDHDAELKRLAHYNREYRPVLIAVDGGADALLEARYRPDVIVGDMDSVSDRALACGAELLVHAYADGRAPGAERAERLGLPYASVATPGISEDLAFLLAYEKGAELLVAVGTHFNLIEFLERNRAGMSSTFVTRLKVGEILVDAKGVSRLASRRVELWPLVALMAVGFAAIVVAIAVSPALRHLLDLLGLRLRELFG